MRVLGVDYGERRTGLAVSDALGLAAHGLPTLTRLPEEQVVAEIVQLAKERDAEAVIVGLPRNMDGSLGPQARKTLAFARKLADAGLSIKLVDERLTTERAHRVMDEAGMSFREKRPRVDRMAAQFILQIYLDSKGAAGRDLSEIE